MYDPADKVTCGPTTHILPALTIGMFAGVPSTLVSFDVNVGLVVPLAPVWRFFADIGQGVADATDVVAVIAKWGQKEWALLVAEAYANDLTARARAWVLSRALVDHIAEALRRFPVLVSGASAPICTVDWEGVISAMRVESSNAEVARRYYDFGTKAKSLYLPYDGQGRTVVFAHRRRDWRGSRAAGGVGPPSHGGPASYAYVSAPTPSTTYGGVGRPMHVGPASYAGAASPDSPFAYGDVGERAPPGGYASTTVAVMPIGTPPFGTVPEAAQPALVTLLPVPVLDVESIPGLVALLGPEVLRRDEGKRRVGDLLVDLPRVAAEAQQALRDAESGGGTSEAGVEHAFGTRPPPPTGIGAFTAECVDYDAPGPEAAHGSGTDGQPGPYSEDRFASRATGRRVMRPPPRLGTNPAGGCRLLTSCTCVK